MRVAALLFALLTLAACGAPTGPPGQASPTSTNPETGSKGSSGK